MEKEEYLILSKVEDNHWWYKSLRRLVFHYLESTKCKLRSKKCCTPSTENSLSNTNSQLPLVILDAGCGTGGLLSSLDNSKDYKIGLDFSDFALQLAQKKTKTPLVKSSVETLPFKDNSFNLIFSLDVLYHKWINNDRKVLMEFNRVLQNSGILMLNLPAYNFLYSKHDRKIFTRRRYHSKEIVQKLKNSNFNVIKITYWNSLLFPFLALIRLIKKFSSSQFSDVKEENIIINKIMEHILSFEFLIIKRFSIPFGLSIFVVCQKI